MYEIVSRTESIRPDIAFFYSSYDTASAYLRSEKYPKKPGEKCVISDACDDILILRLQLNIMTHVTMDDKRVYDVIHKTLNVSIQMLKDSLEKRKEFLNDIRKEGKVVDHRRSHDSADHVIWRWGYWRPDIVRSCIGLYPHWDIYIIDNKAFRKPSKYHALSPDIKCILYGLLLIEKYQLNVNEQSHRNKRDKIRDRYFTKVTDEGLVDLPEGITETHNGVITFLSDDNRHDVMYAFVTECLVEESDLEFFLTTASRDVISEYCRSWCYEKSKGERCLYVPDYPEKMYDLFIDKLQLDIISHCTMSDEGIHDSISKRYGVPWEVLQWDQEARERYVEYAKRGTQTVHHARGMIVGCAGAGKTTLLTRLLGCSEEEIKQVTTTEGLSVHEEIFKICDETKSLIAKSAIKSKDRTENDADTFEKTLTFFDFGGQCAYYACHQIYLTRRAFYILVMDASKRLDQVVDNAVCDQADTAFSGWTYKEYFLFWLKSIHTYCCNVTEGLTGKAEILLVATHWENAVYKNSQEFLDSLHKSLPDQSKLAQYIRKDRCFLAQFPLTPLKELERCIVNITVLSKWSENIPHEWIFLNDEINKKRGIRLFLPFKEIENMMPVQKEKKGQSVRDMLKYYHEVGKCLFFNEDGLKDLVIIDIQWFIDTFKSIITDKLHVKGILATNRDWNEYYETGNLKDTLLDEIWKLNNGSSEKESGKSILHKRKLLLYMQRLGFLAVGEDVHYVPCMNKKEFASPQKQIIQNLPKTSVLVYLFEFLPYFLFYRLVVFCMQLPEWKVLENNRISCLYKKAAMFAYEDHYICLAVTTTSIQLQIFNPEKEKQIAKKVCVLVRRNVDEMMKDITSTFHKHLQFKTGFTCTEERKQVVGEDVEKIFIAESEIHGHGESMICPRHQLESFHKIDTKYLSGFW
ncbi:probable serine/threonine-protein kinase pats1 [Saccostrea cucullata]|uniref:probable serine/threonine-protein kinase pats1 n=1 Tax=Saccostrea cuccullata TaxID=36930 RepID=UPI002ED0B405